MPVTANMELPIDFAGRTGEQSIPPASVRGAFAQYLARVHRCIHPVFGESFLGSLEGLPSKHPLSDPSLFAVVELAVDAGSGALHGLALRRGSGVPLFDQAVLAALRAVFPVHPVPMEIASSNGNVYFTWEFHRDPEEACGTYFARPLMFQF